MTSLLKNKYFKFFAAITLGIGIIFLVTLQSKPQTPTPIQQDSNIEALNILSSYPQTPRVKIANTKNSLTITFDSRLNPITLPQDLKIETNPAVALKTAILPDNPTKLIIYPALEWTENQMYEIKILKGFPNFDHSKELKEDFLIKFTPEKIDQPKYTSPI